MLPHAALGVLRQGWEMGADFSDGTLVVRDGSLTIVADATLYYRHDLLRKLEKARARVSGSSPSHLILGAYRAWGTSCGDHLEGDFAFILWDAELRRVFAARDWSGRRPLYFLQLADRLCIASTIGATRAFPGCPDDWNLTVIGETSSALISSSVETCYTSIRSVAPGTSLTWTPGSGAEVTARWDPTPILSPGGSPPGFDEAAAHLRELLSAAVLERLPRGGPTAISLSGGWDSTAVFGIGQQVIRTGGAGRLAPVSISYPEGDPGREDDLIDETTHYWNCTPTWLSIADIPLFHRTGEDAARRDEPFTHTFEFWNRALANAGQALGARVMLDGYGGDQLFGASNTYLAGLLRQGRIRAFLNEWKPLALRLDLRTQLRWIVLPFLPQALVDVARAARGGRAFRSLFLSPPAPWIRADFATRHDLIGRQEQLFPPGQSVEAQGEIRYYLTSPFFTTVLATVSGYALEGGVEERSPSIDERVVRFAANRPREERNFAGESKRLLRRALQGLLPDRVLAPRKYKTGTTTRYFLTSMMRDFPALARSAFARPVLAELGIVDRSRLQEAVRQLEARAIDAETASQLFFTLQTELWLQGRQAGS